MNRLNKKEIGVLVLIFLFAFIISVIIKYAVTEEPVVEKPAIERPKAVIPEGASDSFIIEKASVSADADACELIDDPVLKDECLRKVDNRLALDRKLVEVKEEYEGASRTDIKLYSKAKLEKDVTICESITHQETKDKCLREVGV